jgi:hypothetical protein
VIRCRLCNWKTKKWITLKDGGKRSGYIRLITHYEECHWEEYLKIHNRLNDEVELKEK